MGDLLPFPSKRSSPSRPAESPKKGREGGLLNTTSNLPKDPKTSPALAQFLLGDLVSVEGLTADQVAGVQAGVSIAFDCRGVFIGLKGDNWGNEVIAVPSYRASDDNWHLLPRIRFYGQRLFGRVHVNGIGEVSYRKFMRILREFLKLPNDCKITVRRTPTKEMWEAYERQAYKR